MYVHEWYDGIGFYPSEDLFKSSDEDCEIAFYSRLYKHIRYSLENNLGNECGISIEDNKFIIKTVEDYINKIEKRQNYNL